MTAVAHDLVSSFAASVEARGEAPLFGLRRDDGWQWLTYATVARQVDRLRASLARLGVVDGDRVAIISDNCPEWAIAAYATFGLGAVFVPMYEAQLETDWRHILVDCGAQVCLVANDAIARRIARLDLARRPTIVTLDAPESAPLSFAQLVSDEVDGAAVPAIRPAPDHVAEIVYTSGTTGTPKGVRLTHENIVSNVRGVVAVVPFDETARSLSFLPWAHVFGGAELHGIIHVGASTALCDSIERLSDRMLEVRPTCLFAVPRVWNKLYQGVRAHIEQSSAPVRAIFAAGRRASRKARRHEHLGAVEYLELAIARRLIFSKVLGRFGGRLQFAVSAAATLSPEVAELIDDVGVVVLEAYGMTECAACATINPPADRRIGSVGKAIPGVRIEIDRTAKREGEQEGVGEIVIFGSGVMAGYHGMPEETARVTTFDGGLRTGDLGRLDADGYLYVTGRLKELYKLENGKYVAPAPIEERLTLSSFIAQAFVYGAERPYNVALLVPDRAALGAWAAREGISTSSDAELLAHPSVRKLYASEITARSADVRPYERVVSFALIDEPFSGDNGLLTPTLKIKRAKVVERYDELLHALYAPRVADAVSRGAGANVAR